MAAELENLKAEVAGGVAASSLVIDETRGPTLPPPLLPSANPTGATPPALHRPLPFHKQSATIKAAADRKRSAKRSRRMRGLIAAIVLAVAGGVIAWSQLADPSKPTTDSTFDPESQFVVDTADFEFVMPTTPVSESLAEQVAGVEITGTAWTIDSDGVYLQALALNLAAPLTDDMAQGSFDASNGGMARRGNGRVISDDRFSQDGVSGSHTIIEADGAMFFVENRAQGRWIVSFVGVSDGDVPPSALQEMVSSFTFH